MACLHDTIRSNLGPPFICHSSKVQNIPIVICGTQKDLTFVSYETIFPGECSLLPLDIWKRAILTINEISPSYLFCEMNTVLFLILPEIASRHNSPSRPHSLTSKLSLASQLSRSNEIQIVVVTSKAYSFSLSAAISRSFPLYSRKSKLNILHQVFVVFNSVDGEFQVPPPDRYSLSLLSDGIRRAQQIVDSPTNEMDTDDFLNQIEQVCKSLQSFNVKLEVIEGKELKKRGFGGIYGVGNQAMSTPKLVILSYVVTGASRTYSLVGKGIVYDTGGLALKSKDNMPGMKRDCGGAAAVLGAFYVIVSQKFAQNIHALFCLAENSVGPNATRPDDIHLLYSGNTVEINNPDAEGRLVVGDGVAYAERDLLSDVIVDLATLTGAQGVTTGKFHGAVLSNDSFWESKVMKIGRITGDCVFPIVYCPELHFQEFNSEVADMKNSVSNYGNATSSCAGLFICSQLSPSFSGIWVHIDMAATVKVAERATGYGVSLLVALFGDETENDYLKYIHKFGQNLVS